MSLQGVIEEMGLGEVIQALTLNRHHGTLRIESDDAGSKFFYISEGEIVLIRTVSSEPVRIGELLVRAGKITREQLNQAILKQQEGGGRLGQTLADLGVIDSPSIELVVKKKFEEEFLDIFLIDRGRFEFIFGLSPESLFAPDEKLERVSLNASGLMLEAMRRVDDWQATLKEVGSLEEIFLNRVKSDAASIESWKLEGVTLPTDSRKEIYDALDGKRTVREALAFAQERGSSRLETFRYVAALKKQELIRALKSEECLGKAKEAIDQKDTLGAAKYIRAVLGKGTVELKTVQRYLEFLRKGTRPQFAHREAKAIAAQFQAGGDLEAAITLYRTALELDPRDTEVLDRIFYALLRQNQIKDAVDIGVQFRNHMQRDSDLPLIARIAKNLKELAPEDHRVLELSGMVAKRQEKLEEAWEDLKLAFAKWPVGHEHAQRRSEILTALIELQPDRSDLVKARAEILEGAALARERKIKIQATIATGAALVVVAILWFVQQEIGARRDLGKAETLLQGTPDALQEQEALSLLERVAASRTFVSSTAEERAQTVRKHLYAELGKSKQKVDDAIRERQEREKLERAEKAKHDREQRVKETLDRIVLAREAKRYDEVVREVTALWDASRDEDPRVKALTIPARLSTTPAGARVQLDGKDTPLRTPCVLELTPRSHTRLRLSMPGFAPVEEDLDATVPILRDLKLVRGPSWRRELDAPLTSPPVAFGDLVVYADRAGVITALEPDDGDVKWTVEAKKQGVTAPLSPLGVVGATLLAVGADGKLIQLDADGNPKPAIELGAPSSFAPTAAGDRALVVAQQGLFVIDLAQKKVLGKHPLPAPSAAGAGSDGERGFVGLVDGRIVAFDLATGKQLWSTDVKLDPCGAPEVIQSLGIVVVAGRSGQIAALSAKDGSLTYNVPPSAGSFDGPVLIEGTRALAATATGVVVAIDLVQGKRAWSERVPNAIAGAPALCQGSLFCPTKDANLVELVAATGKTKDTLALGAAANQRPIAVGTRVVVPIQGRLVGVERAEQ